MCHVDMVAIATCFAADFPKIMFRLLLQSLQPTRFRVRVSGLGFRVKVSCLGFGVRVSGLGFRVKVSGLGFRV